MARQVVHHDAVAGLLRLLGKRHPSAGARLLGMGIANVVVRDRAAIAGWTIMLQAGVAEVLVAKGLIVAGLATSLQ